MKSTHHSFPIRVYYEDTDAAGIVYYANYLKFAERARTEALRRCGIEQTDLMKEHKAGFVVRRVEADFLKPARLDDLLTIKTSLPEMGKASLMMEQVIYRSEETLVKMQVKLAVVNDKMTLAKLPDFVKKAMLKMFEPMK